jgi:hypothetical protein
LARAWAASASAAWAGTARQVAIATTRTGSCFVMEDLDRSAVTNVRESMWVDPRENAKPRDEGRQYPNP